MGVFDSEKACKKGEQDMICPKCKSEIKDDLVVINHFAKEILGELYN